MKKHFNKLLSIMLSACLCVPAFPATPVQAAETDGVIFMEPTTIKISNITGERFTNFNEGWKFNLGDSASAPETDFNDAAWKDVNLPHDFSISQDFTDKGEAESGFLPGGTGWYRKTFIMPDELNGKSFVLNFDGVYSDAYVYVNGEYIGEHHYGYTPFAFDISSHLICDGSTDNVIAVKAVNDIPTSRWYSGSGIYRDVTMVITDPVHVALDGTTVTTPDIASGKGTVDVQVNIANDSDTDAEITMKNTVYTSDGDSVAASEEVSVTVAANTSVPASASLEVAAPKLWSIEEPNRYYVRTELSANGTVIDTYDSNFGFRWYAFDDATGFSLNGQNVKINGVCMHHDQGALGASAYYDAIYRQLSIMKDMGANTIRITHNPASKTYIEICDQLGLLVIEEFFDGWNLSKNGNRNDFSKYFTTKLNANNQILNGNSDMTWAEYVLKSVVRRDINNPSIILWSLGNELKESYGDYSQNLKPADDLIQWTTEADPSRLITIGDNDRNSNSNLTAIVDKVTAANGIAGFNYSSESQLISLSQKYGCILASETASAINSRSRYMSQASGGNADGKYHLTSYDTSRVGWGKTAQLSMWDTIRYDQIAGQCVWTGFDYIGEPTPWNGTDPGSKTGQGPIPNSSYFGIVETTGFEKDTYYLYRSQWNQKEPTLHLVTAWDSDNMINNAGKTPVVVYSNAPKVELYRDGTKIGTAIRTEHTTDAGHTYYTYATESNHSVCTTTSGSNEASLYATFNVEYQKGSISAKAFDADNQEITDDCAGVTSVTTPDEASKLVISSNQTEIAADGSSLAYITVDVTDNNGNLDTMATNNIRFTLSGEGEIAGVDNGDQATTKKYQQASALQSAASANIDVYAGKALVIVRSTKNADSLTLTASSDGFEDVSVQVKTVGGASVDPDSIVSYQMVKHGYVPTGAVTKIELPKSVEATTLGGETKTMNIQWDTYDPVNLTKKGNFRINGTIGEGANLIPVFMTIHVYDAIAGIQGFSFYTMPKQVPTLPTMAAAYYADGTVFEEYPVSWDTSVLTETALSEIGTVVTVNGTVEILGQTYPTKATVRVAEPVQIASTNVAVNKDHLVDNGPYADSLASLTDELRYDNGQSSSRWSTWSNPVSARPAKDDIQITMDWATAITTDQINLYHFFRDPNWTQSNGTPITNDGSAMPSSIKFEYTSVSNYDEANGTINANEWTEIGYQEPEVIDVSSVSGNTHNWTHAFAYKLDHSINPQAIRITLAHEAGQFVGLNEIEVISPVYTTEPNTSAALEDVSVNGKEITLSDDQTVYLLEDDTITAENIAYNNPSNAAITVLQGSDCQVRIIAVSEDGQDTRTYVFAKAPTNETKDELQTIIDQYKNNSDLYAPGSYEAIKALIEKIENDRDSMTEFELQESIKAIENASKNLVLMPTSERKKELQDKLDAYKALDSSLYTPESYQTLQDLVKQIQENIDNLTKDELEVQWTALEDAYSKLEKVGPSAAKLALLAKLNEYKALDGKLYTVESFQNLQNLIAQIERTIDSMSEAELQSNLTALENAYKSLQPASSGDQTPPGGQTPGDQTPPGGQTPGDQTPPGGQTPVPAPAIKKGDTKTVKGVQYKVLDAAKKTVTAYKAAKKTLSSSKTVTIPDTVTINGVKCKVVQISNNAFKGAKKLTTVTMGKNIKQIGKNAFYNSKKLKKLVFKSTTAPSISTGAFKKSASKVTVTVPKKMSKSQKNKLQQRLKKSGVKKIQLKTAK